jgi:hypothetical protein
VGGAAHQPGHQQAGQQAAVFDRHRSAMGETRTQQIDKQDFLVHGVFTIGLGRERLAPAEPYIRYVL